LPDKAGFSVLQGTTDLASAASRSKATKEQGWKATSRITPEAGGWEAVMRSGHLQVTRTEDVLVVRFLDRKLAGDLPDRLEEELYGVADQEDCKRILLSFAGVQFLASDMLDKVVQLNKKMKQKGGRLMLCEMCPYLREIFVTTKLDSIIDLTNTESEGLAACA